MMNTARMENNIPNLSSLNPMYLNESAKVLSYSRNRRGVRIRRPDNTIVVAVKKRDMFLKRRVLFSRLVSSAIGCTWTIFWRDHSVCSLRFESDLTPFYISPDDVMTFASFLVIAKLIRLRRRTY